MIKKSFKVTLISCSFALAAGNASASAWLTGPIAELWVNDASSSNVVWVSVGISFASTCGATSTYLVADLSEPGMKEAYAMALSASMAGRPVKMMGAGACYGQYEKLKSIYITHPST